ncbi:MAG: hypothetical protein GX610_00845 [Rhodococcus sp.]|nr:hypothetical protein [Rhodococcus sp. (in: high G+C Gram-positive bacteria)]
MSTLWFVDTPDPAAVLGNAESPDGDAALAVAQRLHPNMDLAPTGVVPLSQAAGVTDDVLYVGAFPGLVVVCHKDLTPTTPTTTPWRSAIDSATTYLVASRPEDAWGAFAVWEGDTLRRSFSAAPATILEDSGIPLVWERPYWAGEFPLQHPPGALPDPQSLPFHPQQFAEAANREWLGFRYTGARSEGELNPTSIGLLGFTVHPPGQAPRPNPPTTDASAARDSAAAAPATGAVKRTFLDRIRRKTR